MRDGDQALYLDRLRGQASVPVVSSVGSRLPLHATGVGKVLLAHAPVEVRRQVLAGLTRVTAYTLTQPGTLDRQLEQVRHDQRGDEPRRVLAGRPGAPRREVVAALGIVVLSLRGQRARLVAPLQVAALGIGRAVGSGYPATRLPDGRGRRVD